MKIHYIIKWCIRNCDFELLIKQNYNEKESLFGQLHGLSFQFTALSLELFVSF